MKKIKLKTILATCLALGILSGCSSSGERPVSLTLATGSTGGTYYILGAAISNIWSSELENFNINSIPSGASIENMNLLNIEEIQLAFAMNSIADNCYNGTGVFEEGGAKTNFKTIGVIHPEVFQVVANANTNASTMSDLRGYKVAIGPVGSGTAITSEIAFTTAGLDISKDVSLERDSFSDAVTKMQDNLLDASCSIISVPASGITELETVKSINFINISDEELSIIQEDYPYFSRYIIPAGTYSNTVDVETIACQAALYCSTNLDDDVVYALTKTLYESGETLAMAHVAGGQVDINLALEGITTPLHQGAINYYEEQGIHIPDELR